MARRRRWSPDETRRRSGVVGAQLVEAGVDIDFPVVYRALAGLDSIARLPVVAIARGGWTRAKCMSSCRPDQRRRGCCAVAEQATRILWEALPPRPSRSGVVAFRLFRRLYGDADLDAKDVCRFAARRPDRRRQFPHRRQSASPHRRSREVPRSLSATSAMRRRCHRRVAENTLKRKAQQRWLLRQAATLWRGRLPARPETSGRGRATSKRWAAISRVCTCSRLATMCLETGCWASMWMARRAIRGDLVLW